MTGFCWLPPVDFRGCTTASFLSPIPQMIIAASFDPGRLQLLVPKAFGFTLDERFGKASFWCWIVGFYLPSRRSNALGLME